MKRIGHTVVTALGSLVIAAASASNASAGCVDLSAMTTPVRWAAPIRPSFSPQGSASDARSSNSDESIVGLWQFQFTSVGNNVAPVFIEDGTVLDAGYTQWHSDSTEIMNSSRDPATSNFCLGVWKKTGPRSYKLNHFALSWDNTGRFCQPEAGAASCFVGPTNIREQVAINGGNYTGEVTITQYDTKGNMMFELHGAIAAKRLEAD